jgi:tagaturonate reductase
MNGLPRLSRELVASPLMAGRADVDVPPARILDLPERVVQFGTGAFLRGFAAWLIDDANRAGRFGGSIVAVASTDSKREAVLNAQDGLFTLSIQGGGAGQDARPRHRIIASVSRALSAATQWNDVLALARDPNIELVISNTTEVGLALDRADSPDMVPPRSFPAKLTQFLFERAKAFDYDATRGLVILPCELVEDNGATLERLVRELAASWRLGQEFRAWLDDAVVFCNTLVDRIVPGAPSKAEVERFERVHGYRDGLATSCESYALFAIEGDDALRARLGFPGEDPCVIVAPDIRPYRERKIRLLNGAHTIVVPVALLAGLATVRDAVRDRRVGGFLRRVMLDEIAPSLDAPPPGAESFANEVLRRFDNPYIDHALVDITLHGTTKMRVRVVPSILAFASQTGRAPASLAFGFAAFLAFMRGDLHAERRSAGLAVPPDAEGERVRAVWQSLRPRAEDEFLELARRVCADEQLWGVDLMSVPGFVELVAEHLMRICRQGVLSALDAQLTESATLT